jgi:hypothetical protein
MKAKLSEAELLANAKMKKAVASLEELLQKSVDAAK